MNIRLLSDFTDYYDHWFDSSAKQTFRRYSTDGLDRFGQLDLMERNGLRVPPWGSVRRLVNDPGRYGAPEAKLPKLSKNAKSLVVYTDPKAHCGEGKVLLSIDEAMARHPDCLATEYIADCPGLSWRYLQIGIHGFWLECRSDTDWRSNYGDGSWQVIGRQEGWGPPPFVVKRPLYAIDFVIGDRLYAVDYNVSPGVRGTGVERLLPPKHAAESIAKACEVR